jgi:Flp pilus assembly protein TadG
MTHPPRHTQLPGLLRRLAATGDTGASTAELVLLTPLLVTILLFVVLCGRLVAAQLDLDAAAGSAARAASLARTDTSAHTQADNAAHDTLTTRNLTCRHTTTTVATGGLHPGGVVTVTVSCTVPLSDLLRLGVPGTRTLTATATSPVDRWRASVRGFASSAATSGGNPNGHLR